MTAFVIDAAMDALLDHIADNATAVHVCSGNPTTRAEVLSQSLANAAVNSGNYTKANGDVSGRKHTRAQLSDLSIGTSGTTGTVCAIDGTDMLHKADVTSPQAITAGGTVTVNASDHEVRDAA